MTLTQRALELVEAERLRQNRKWGDQSGKTDPVWLAVLVEECGEAAEAVLDVDEVVLFGEVVQCAAVAIAWLEAMIKRSHKAVLKSRRTRRTVRGPLPLLAHLGSPCARCRLRRERLTRYGVNRVTGFIRCPLLDCTSRARTTAEEEAKPCLEPKG